MSPTSKFSENSANIVSPRGPWFRFSQTHLQWLQARAQERGFAGPTRVLAELLDRAIVDRDATR